mmetsp:Transcript_18164/g.20930  ORF Transcript_18164/g.20930 Transcript_18164/m.20930 type:complete len:83 (+) Transcript_18164:847-1095(+)
MTNDFLIQADVDVVVVVVVIKGWEEEQFVSHHDGTHVAHVDDNALLAREERLTAAHAAATTNTPTYTTVGAAKRGVFRINNA